MADAVLTTESVTLWELLTGPRLSLHLPRFALFLFLSIILEIKWGLKKIQWRCSIPTVILQLITGISGVVAYYFMVTATFYTGDRVAITVWYYPITGSILLCLTILFIRGIDPLLKGTSKKNGVARCIIFALSAYFAISTIMTPHKMNRSLDRCEKENRTSARTLSPAPLAQSDA